MFICLHTFVVYINIHVYVHIYVERDIYVHIQPNYVQ
jgi:hypothetical protein